jgi:hypothetical protein
MTENQGLQEVAEQYRKDGYKVVTHPEKDDLPAFLQGPDIDLLALKNDQIVAIQAKNGSLPEEKPQVLISGQIDDAYSLSLLAEAERLLMPDTPRSAILMAWAAFEAAAREVLRDKEKDVEKRLPRELLDELRDKNFLTPLEYQMLRQAMYVRNAIAHGVKPDAVPDEFVRFLLNMVRKLKARQPSDAVGITDRVSITIHRAGINEHPELCKLVNQAERTLGEVIGQSRSSVSVEWDLAEDGKGRPIIVLKLSDFTGAVTATFAPDELEKPIHLRTRLYRLWGDLLQIRTKKQLESM